MYTGGECTMVECVKCVNGGVCEVCTLVESVQWWSVWSVYTGGVCTLVECVKCVHWWSMYTVGVCTLV